MKKLKYKTKKDIDIGIWEVPQGFTQTHSFEYEVKNGKVKPHKKKLTKSQLNKLKNERK